MAIKFDILNRFSGGAQCTAEIECEDDAPRSVKLGLAVKWANLSGADLHWADLRGADLHWADLHWANLRGADLSGANLRGADLSRADLSGADLSGANLSGADLNGADLSRADLSGANLRVVGGRSDGYFFFIIKNADASITLHAGCRRFSFAEAREYWSRTRGGTTLGDESLALVDHAERMAKITGWIRG